MRENVSGRGTFAEGFWVRQWTSLISVTKLFVDNGIELEQKKRGPRNGCPPSLLSVFLCFSFLTQDPQAHGGFRRYPTLGDLATRSSDQVASVERC